MSKSKRKNEKDSSTGDVEQSPNSKSYVVDSTL